MKLRVIAIFAAALVFASGCTTVGSETAYIQSAVPTLTVSAKPEVTAVAATYPPIDDNHFVVECEEYLSVRAEPDIFADRVDKLMPGEVVEVEDYHGAFARINYGGTVGYVLAAHLVREAGADYADMLDVVEVDDELYTYEEMQEDIAALTETYPETVERDILGESEFGVEIPIMRLGDEDAESHVLIHGAMHGREYITTTLLMLLSENVLKYDISALNDVCLHVIPMVNPDGVAISQSGKTQDEVAEIYAYERAKGITDLPPDEYARRWKANGLGVDLNTNFNGGNWDTERGKDEPSSQDYFGTAPLSAAEANALAEYTLEYDFDATLSYHCAGSLIFYEYGTNVKANRLSHMLGKTVSELTGYTLEPAGDGDGAGYKDWAIQRLGIPSLTVEIGYGDAPLPLSQVNEAFIRNRMVFGAVADWVALD